MRIRNHNRYRAPLIIVLALSFQDPAFCVLSTNKTFMLNDGQGGTTNNVLPPGATNFFAVNSNLLNQAVNNTHGSGGGGGTVTFDPNRYTTNASGQVTLTNVPGAELFVDAVTNLHLDPTGNVPCDIATSNFLATIDTNKDFNVVLNFPATPFTGSVYLFTNELLIPCHLLTGLPGTVGRLTLRGSTDSCAWLLPGATNGVLFKLTGITQTNFIGSLFGSQPNSGISNATMVTIENIDFEATTNSDFTSGVLNFYNFQSVDIENCAVFTGLYPTALADQPYTNTIGINLPQIASIPNNIVHNVNICGFSKGVTCGEAASLDTVDISACTYAIFGSGGVHPNKLRGVFIQGCPGIFGASADTVFGGDVGIESDGNPGDGWPSWTRTYYHIRDPNQHVHGSINFNLWDDAAATLTTLTTLGGAADFYAHSLRTPLPVDKYGNVDVVSGISISPGTVMAAPPVLTTSSNTILTFSFCGPFGGGGSQIGLTNSWPWSLGAGSNGQAIVYFSEFGVSPNGSCNYTTAMTGMAHFTNNSAGSGAATDSFAPILSGSGPPTSYVFHADANGWSVARTFGGAQTCNATEMGTIIYTYAP